MAQGSGNAREISLGDDFGDVVVKANGVRIEVHTDGSVDAYTERPVNVHPSANDSASRVPFGYIGPEIGEKIEAGYVEIDGKHKGEIYGGIYPADNKPIWFSTAPKLMDHYAAAAWAEGQGGSLPTRKQGDYLTTLKGKGGGFTEIFNRGNSFPAGFVWLAEPLTFNSIGAWCQRLSVGDQYYVDRYGELPALSVRR